MARLSLLILAVALLLLGALPQSRSVYAAPCPAGAIVVNTTADTVAANPGDSALDANGAISLRSAVMRANQRFGPDTICLAAATYTLTLGPMDDEGPNTLLESSGDIDILDGGDVTIVGVSAAATIVQAGTSRSTNGADGNGIDRVFHI
ncbi:MAG TPA: hypothetical protein VJB57_05490, partial [Dehalococcoidia bacterium]|nr:hypothetical protein [Dehalococcoidia bacterium]